VAGENSTYILFLALEGSLIVSESVVEEICTNKLEKRLKTYNILSRLSNKKNAEVAKIAPTNFQVQFR
jgi:hypothetical protein